MGYCWSSIMPTSSANGLSVSTWSAEASPVMWMAMVAILTHHGSRTHRSGTGTAPSVGLDGQHGAVRVEQHPLGVAAQDQLAHRGAPAQHDDDELCGDLLGDGEQVLGGLEARLR